MKLTGREWALKVAFVLFMVFWYAMFTFMQTHSEFVRVQFVQICNIIGFVAGALLLPLVLPLRVLRQGVSQTPGSRPSRYALRLVILGLVFIPNIVVRLAGADAWQASLTLTAVMAVGNGVVIVLVCGLFVSFAVKNRAFWAALAYSAGILVFYLGTAAAGRGLPFLEPLLFYGSGLAQIAAGVFVFLFLIKAGNRESNSDYNTTIGLSPDSSNNNTIHYQLTTNNFSFLFPLLAVVAICWTNSFTNRLFSPLMYLPPGNSVFNISILATLLLLPVLGYIAGLGWRRFLSVFVVVCSVFLLLSPCLILFRGSELLFIVLYTLNGTFVHFIVAVFPFVISDLYWRDGRGTGYWAWLVAAACFMIRATIVAQVGLFKAVSLDDSYTVLILIIGVILFSAFCYLFLRSLPDAKLPESIIIPESPFPIEEIFKAYRLSRRETEVAALLVKEGLTNEEIGKRLFISSETIKSHIQSIYRKFAVKSRAEFVVKVLGQREKIL